MPTRPLTASLVLIGLFGLSGGGCASSFRYDTSDDTPPAPLTHPTTVPSSVDADTDTFGGTLRAVFVDLPKRLIETAEGNTPSAQAVALEDSKYPDRRRQGIDALMTYSFARRPPYTTRYGQIASFDAAPSVRLTAVRALNYSRDATATGKYVAALSDESPGVRLEGVKALSNVPDEQARPDLLKLFQDANQDIDTRIAAADALRQYRSLESARALVNVLNDREFGLAWQARQSLRTMTGHDAFYDQSAWLTYLTGPDHPLD